MIQDFYDENGKNGKIKVGHRVGHRVGHGLGPGFVVTPSQTLTLVADRGNDGTGLSGGFTITASSVLVL
jgi:hypothetical protein